MHGACDAAAHMVTPLIVRRATTAGADLDEPSLAGIGPPCCTSARRADQAERVNWYSAPVTSA